MTRHRQTGRPTLPRLLRRAQLGTALLAVTLAGLTLTVAGFFALRVYANATLQQIATSMSYTVEAAVVFKDRVAAEEAVATIASPEEVARAVVLDRDGAILADWQRPSGDALLRVEQFVTDLAFSEPVMVPIIHEGATVGSIQLHGSATGLLRFLVIGAGVMLACLALSMAGALLLSRHLQAGILGPLRTLANVAHAVRQDRAFTRRVPPAAIAELNQIGDDFNALLGELERWHARLERENASLAHQARHDSLTGLPNRAVFEAMLEEAVQEASAIGRRVGVLFLDSDRFKETNDRLGHAAGDIVLTIVASRIRNRVRAEDLVSRIGGDEFAVLLAPMGEIDDAVRVADSILAGMAEPISLPNGQIAASSVSIGIAVYPEHAPDAANLLKRADEAMYFAKRVQPGGWRIAGHNGPPSDDLETRIA